MTIEYIKARVYVKHWVDINYKSDENNKKQVQEQIKEDLKKRFGNNIEVELTTRYKP